MSDIVFSEKAFEDFLYFQMNDKSAFKKIGTLIKDIQRNGIATGIGKPEALKYRKAWSRRINHEDRLVYNMNEQDQLVILSLRGHYED